MTNALVNNSQSRRLEEIRRQLEHILFAINDVAAVSVKPAEVKIFLVRDSPAIRSSIDLIVHQKHPGAHLQYELSGEFRPL
jgi:hypothetical protein